MEICLARRSRDASWCRMTTRCWPARRGIRTIATKIGCVRLRRNCACRWWWSWKAAGGRPGVLSEWTCADQRWWRNIIPETRLRVYDVHTVIETMADTGSVLETRREFGLTMIAAFIRIEGKPFGVVATSPKHLAGAIDSDGPD